MNTTAQDWIYRVIGAMDNYNMTTENDNLAEIIADLIRETPRELINDVMRDISRYAIAKQQEYTKKRALELLIATPPPLPADSDDEREERSNDEKEEADDEHSEEADDERSDDAEATEEHSDEDAEATEIGDIQNAYNEMHEMIQNLEPSAVMLEHLEEWPEIAYEVDKWEYMLLHHLIVKCAPLSVIQAVMKENPDALTFEVGNEGYVPLQLAVRHGRSLEVIQAIYKANPQMIQKVSRWGNTAHALACKYQRDVSIKVFLYTHRDAAPLEDKDDDDDMPGLIPITPPPEKDFLTEYVRSVGLREAYPVLVILLAWITMLTLSLLAGVRMLI